MVMIRRPAIERSTKIVRLARVKTNEKVQKLGHVYDGLHEVSYMPSISNGTVSDNRGHR